MGVSFSSGVPKYVFTQAVAPSGEGEVEGSLWYDTVGGKLYTYDGAIWVLVAVASGNSDGILHLFATSYDSVIQGTWNIAQSDTYYLQTYITTGTHNINDGIQWKAMMKAGTYTIRLLTLQTTDRGIAHIDVGGTEVTTLDTYDGGGATNVIKKATGVTIVADGYVTIKLEMKSKNGSSSSYGLTMSLLSFERTA